MNTNAACVLHTTTLSPMSEVNSVTTADENEARHPCSSKSMEITAIVTRVRPCNIHTWQMLFGNELVMHSCLQIDGATAAYIVKPMYH